MQYIFKNTVIALGFAVNVVAAAPHFTPVETPNEIIYIIQLPGDTDWPQPVSANPT